MYHDPFKCFAAVIESGARAVPGVDMAAGWECTYAEHALSRVNISWTTAARTAETAPAGTLRLRRQGEGVNGVRLSVDYEREIWPVNPRLAAEIDCAVGVLLTPRHWRLRYSRTRRGPAHVDVGHEEDGEFGDGTVTVRTGDGSRVLSRRQGVGALGCTFSLLAGLSGAAHREGRVEHLDYLEELVLHHAGCELRAVAPGPYSDPRGLARTCWKLSGPGLMPTEFWTNEFGQVQYVFAGPQRAFVLVSCRQLSA